MKAGITGPTGLFFISFLFLTCLSGFVLGMDCPEGLVGGDVDGVQLNGFEIQGDGTLNETST